MSGKARYWEVPVLVAPPDTPADSLLVGYIHDCRRLVSLAGGRPHPEILFGPACPNIRPLVVDAPPWASHPHHHHHSSSSSSSSSSSPASPPPSHPLVELLAAFFDKQNMHRTLERVGCFVLCQRLVAWLIHPTPETYAGLGALTPRPCQQAVAHNQWVDFVLWGRLREAILQQAGAYATDEFLHFYCINLRLPHWHGGPSAAFRGDEATGALLLTDSFLHHVLDPRQWSLGEDFFRRYPELAGAVAFQSHDY